MTLAWTKSRRPRGRPRTVRAKVGGAWVDLGNPAALAAAAAESGIDPEVLAVDVLRQQGGTPALPFAADIGPAELGAAGRAIADVLDVAVAQTLVESLAAAIAHWRTASAVYAGEAKGRPRSADPILVADCARALRTAGFKGSIGGDTEGAPRSDAVRLADALLRQAGERRRVSTQSIWRARGIIYRDTQE